MLVVSVRAYSYGPLAHWYILKEFRGMGLSSLYRREVCRCVAEDGDIPQSLVDSDNSNAIHNMIKKAGFVKMHEEKSL